MNLRVLLPFKIFVEKIEVLRIVAETRHGSFGILPHRLDCVAALAPGILTYDTKQGGTVYLAVDEGVLVKSGEDVRVSVRHAIRGKDLSQLHEAVKREFLSLDAGEQQLRAAICKIEAGFLRRVAEFSHEH